MQQREPRLNSPLEAKLTVWICMKIYRKIDETVKMHTAAIKVYILVVFYCFRPINAILGSFDVLSSHLLRRRQGKTRLSYAARRKRSKT